MHVQPSPPVEVDSSTYHYEDYLADMGNSASAEHGSIEASPPMDTEANHIGRLQAITGARAVETKVKPRGPKAEAADYDFILVGGTCAVLGILPAAGQQCLCRIWHKLCDARSLESAHPCLSWADHPAWRRAGPLVSALTVAHCGSHAAACVLPTHVLRWVAVVHCCRTP